MTAVGRAARFKRSCRNALSLCNLPCTRRIYASPPQPFPCRSSTSPRPLQHRAIDTRAPPPHTTNAAHAQLIAMVQAGDKVSI